jgi:hypothetical protein
MEANLERKVWRWDKKREREAEGERKWGAQCGGEFGEESAAVREGRRKRGGGEEWGEVLGLDGLGYQAYVSWYLAEARIIVFFII